eukprot:1152809-Pelagomonas_calceolata.AAC.9
MSVQDVTACPGLTEQQRRPAACPLADHFTTLSSNNESGHVLALAQAIAFKPVPCDPCASA